MPLLNRLRRRWRALAHRDALEQDVDEEMRFHLEQAAAELVARGATPDEARRLAYASFGRPEAHKETARDLTGVRWLQDAARDARYAIQGLKRRPGFAFTTVLTLALGISATTLVFSAVDALFLRRLPVQAPDRLFIISEQWKNGTPSSSAAELTYPYEHYLDLAESSQSLFSDLVATSLTASSVRLGDYATDLTAWVVSSNYFTTLGIRPKLGRFFSPASERAGDAPPEAVISEDLWQRRFNSDSSVIGKILYADSRALTIVGVAPGEFHGTMQGVLGDLWIPTGVVRRLPTVSGPPRLDDIFVTVFGRLRPGVALDRAQAELTSIDQHLPSEHQMDTHAQVRAVRLDPVSGLPSMARGAFTIFMATLMATAALVLLIALANVAGMLLARGTYRRREFAMRLALGAGRGRLVRQLLTETVILCGLGALGGVLLARAAFASIPGLIPPIPLHVAFDIRLDWLVLAFTTAIAIVSGVLAGLTPALSATRVDVLSGLRGSTQGQPGHISRTRDGFVVAQLALSVVLLIGAGLFMRALNRGLRIDPGFDAHAVVASRVDLDSHAYDDAHARAFFGQYLERLRVRAEIAEASLGFWTPLSNNNNGERVYLPGEQAPHGNSIGMGYSVVDAEYLRMMHTPIVLGRSLRATDDEGAPPVIVINQTAARKLWPGESPIGKRIKLGGGVEREVVGVVRDGKYRGLDEAPTAYGFIPYVQFHGLRHYTIYARARGDSTTVALAMRQELAALDPNIALEAPGPLSGQLAFYLFPQQVGAAVIGIFGCVGLVLAIVGIYGVIAYHVGQRMREFGIRLALGAGRVGLIKLVLGRGARLVVVGVVVGAGLALMLGFAARSFLYGVDAYDPLTFGGVSIALAVVALVATYLPARRAAGVDPMASLRIE